MGKTILKKNQKAILAFVKISIFEFYIESKIRKNEIQKNPSKIKW